MCSQFYNILYHLANGKIKYNPNLPKITTVLIKMAVENGHSDLERNTHRKMTIVMIQYFPKIVECRVAFSSNGSKYRHPIFSYSLH